MCGMVGVCMLMIESCLLERTKSMNFERTHE